ncbi:MAG: hypothetical protein K6B46_03345 [Opitutales bacterium]|nr:hypothetical protein [Opitutales bacterium]
MGFGRERWRWHWRERAAVAADGNAVPGFEIVPAKFRLAGTIFLCRLGSRANLTSSFCRA